MLCAVPREFVLLDWYKIEESSNDVTIVPEVSDTASQTQIEAWHTIKPQQYKIRVVERLGNLMDTNILGFRRQDKYADTNR